MLDGAALSAALAAAPLGLLEQLAIHRCRLNDAVVWQLDEDWGRPAVWTWGCTS